MNKLLLVNHSANKRQKNILNSLRSQLFALEVISKQFVIKALFNKNNKLKKIPAVNKD